MALTPMEKAKMAKAVKEKAEAKKEEPVEKVEEVEEIEKVEPEIQVDLEKLKESKTKPKIVETPMNLETKLDAILEKIPAIEECKQICEFLLDHY